MHLPFSSYFNVKSTSSSLSICIIFLGLPYKLFQTWWLRTAEYYSLTVLGVKRPKSRCQQGCAPSGDSREEFFLTSSSSCDSKEIRGVPWLVAASLQSLSPSSHGLLFFFLCASHIRTPVIGFRAHLPNPRWSHLEILYLITSVITLLQIRSHSKVPGIRVQTYLLGGHHSIHYNY